jgi:inosine-uridine nucleoside N-ribohydrolase
MNIILETDLGGDPDDFFAFCYLASAGVNVKGIVVTPAHPFQVKLMRMICNQLGWDIPIGGTHLRMNDYSDYTGFWQKVADRYRADQFSGEVDCEGYEVIEKCYKEDPDITFVVIGPPTNTGKFLERNPNVKIKKLLMQGGFIGYDAHDDPNVVRLPKFEGKDAVPSFNPSNDSGSMVRIQYADIDELTFVSKNVCHTVIMDHEKYLEVLKYWKNRNATPAADLYIGGLIEYDLQNKEKRFHDPTACICLLHPEIARWAKGSLICSAKGKRVCWRFEVREGTNQKIITSIDYDKLWNYLITLT